MEQRPDAGSEWPMLDLTEPTSKGLVRPSKNTFSIAKPSAGSPMGVPVKQCAIFIIIINLIV